MHPLVGPPAGQRPMTPPPAMMPPAMERPTFQALLQGLPVLGRAGDWHARVSCLVTDSRRIMSKSRNRLSAATMQIPTLIAMPSPLGWAQNSASTPMRMPGSGCQPNFRSQLTSGATCQYSQGSAVGCFTNRLAS